MANTTRQSFKEPDVRAGAGQFDVAEAFTSNLRKRDFNTAFVADHTAVFHPLVLAAQALPVGYRTENASAEKAVLLGLERSVIDGLRFCDFTMRPRANLFWRSQTDPDAVKIGDRRRPVVRIRSNQSSTLFSRG